MNIKSLSRWSTLCFVGLFSLNAIADNLAERKQDVSVAGYGIRVPASTLSGLQPLDEESVLAFQQGVPSSLAEQKNLEAISQYSLSGPESIDERDESADATTAVEPVRVHIGYGAYDYSGRSAIDNKNEIFGVGN